MTKKLDFNRRQFVGVAAATVAAGPLGLFGRVNAMTQALTDVAQPTGSGQTEIRPFRFTASDADLTDLRRRINATRWPEREIVNDQSQGVQLATMQNLARDWGTAVTEQLALLQPAGLIGIHTNMPATVPADIDKAAAAGAPAPSGLSADEGQAYDQLAYFYKHGLGYAQEMANRPQTLYGIGDSPVGMAAWMLDHDAVSMALMSRVFDGQREGLTRDDILDNVTLYWLTNTTVSSARLYWESKLAFFAPKNVPVPTAVTAFPDELYQAPKSWTEKAYPKLIHYNRVAKGGHFAAWEQPDTFVIELRAGFKSLRSA